MTAETRSGRSVIYRELGGPEVLQVENRLVAQPGDAEVLLRFVAGGLNPVDAKIRAGRSKFSMPLPAAVGREFSGIVDSVGPGVQRFAVGDAAFGSIPQGAFADWVLAPESVLSHVPSGVPMTVAAGIALAGQTAWESLESQNLAAGDVIVVSAAAGGVGGILAQLAVSRGIRVIGTASEGNHDWLRSRGVEPVLYGPGLRDRLSELAPNGVTAVFDHHGPETIEAALALEVPLERINTIATDASVYGVRNVGRGAVHPPTLDALAALVADGTIEIPLAATFPVSEVRAAFEYLERGHLRGKVVVTAD